jgi:hypothetical protein
VREEGETIMGTGLTRRFRGLYTVLSVTAMAVTFVLSAVRDALCLRRLLRRADQRSTRTTPPGTSTRRPPVTTVEHPLVKT